MTTLQAFHLVFIALWGGVLACEGLMEFLPVKTALEGKQIAKLHYRIDLLLEAPLLLAILITGVLLLGDVQWSALLVVKVVAALVLIAANAACIAVVVKRYRDLAGAGDDRAFAVFASQTRRIHRIIFTFTPLGLLVFALGLYLVR